MKSTAARSVIRTTLLMLLCCTFQSAIGGSDDKNKKSPGGGAFTIIELKPADGPLLDQLKAQIKTAKESNRKPFVEFRADWCGPCKALEASLNDPSMIDAFSGTCIIRLDADAWSGKLRGTGFSANTIPVFYEINDDGTPTGRKIDGGAWGDNTPANMAPPLKAFFKGS